MKLNTKFIVIPILLSTSNVSAIPIEWDVSSGGNGNFYELILTPSLTWDEANSTANSLGVNWHLATITSAAENAFIENFLSPGSPHFESNCLVSNLVGRVCQGLWLGGFSSSTSANDWQWITGEAFTYTDWGPTAPFGNGDRLQIAEFRDQGQLVAWNDIDGARNSRMTGFIVEHEGALAVPMPAPSIFALLTGGLIGLGFTRRHCNRQVNTL